jgi:hypothetical protein
LLARREPHVFDHRRPGGFVVVRTVDPDGIRARLDELLREPWVDGDLGG